MIQLKQDRDDAEAKQYPQQLLDILTASTTVMEGGSTGSDESASAAGSSAEGGTPTALAGGDPLTAFYDNAHSAAAAAAESEQQQQRGIAGLAIAPRTTPADEIRDTRSLDRAYTQRLSLLVQDSASGLWGLPEGVRLPGEPMVQAAQRCLREAWGPDPSLDLWYVGGAPVGHVLRVNPPDVQAATGVYGAKVFIYRAEIIAGRFRLPTTAPTASRFSDFGWYSRDEAEAVLDRPLWKYLHQVMGSGAGEELAREEAWLARIEARGLTVAQASGRRAYRVRRTRLSHAASKASGSPRSAGFRLPAIATRDQAVLAAAPWVGEGRDTKSAALAAAGDAYHLRVADQKIRSAVLAKTLATPTAAALAALRRQKLSTNLGAPAANK